MATCIQLGPKSSAKLNSPFLLPDTRKYELSLDEYISEMFPRFLKNIFLGCKNGRKLLKNVHLQGRARIHNFRFSKGKEDQGFEPGRSLFSQPEGNIQAILAT